MAATETTNDDKGASEFGVIEGPDLNVSRSPFDKKQYRQILLPNGLRAVLVSDTVAMTQAYNLGGVLDEEDDDDDDDDDSSDGDDEEGKTEENAKDEPPRDSNEDNESDSDSDDEENDKGGQNDGGFRNAAAAMIVGVGSLYDPPECQGMAHFLEHLLFLGSEKYPEENAYDSYMSKHGGSDNAYTDDEHTLYHFEIPQEQLSGALDLFAQFFVAPLLKSDSVERELRAIESEFMLAKNSDGCRSEHLLAYTSGKSLEEHPASKFGWGNYHSLKTLPEKDGIEPLQKLREFYGKHHYASNMRLVVMGGYPLDYLQKQVVKHFSEIRSKDPLGSYTWDQTNASPLRSYGLPLAPSSLQRIFYVAPVRDRHGLSVTWQIPPQMEHWRTKPCDYLAHLIGHEGKGSLLALLRNRSWASELSAGVGDGGDENATTHAYFTVTITLSKEGVEHWKDVLSELYRYIGMLRHGCRQEGGLPLWIYEELRSIHEVSHRYADEDPPEDFVVDLAEELSPWANTPPERLLDASGLLFDHDPATILGLLDHSLTPGNARLDLSSTVFGRAGDYEENESNGESKEDSVEYLSYYNRFDLHKSCLPPSNEIFDPSKAGPPNIEPYFGTPFWCQKLDDALLEHWCKCAEPQEPPVDSMLSLPPQNEFIPTDFSLKPLPPADCDHPLLNCSIKLQIPVGKRKEWFPATVTQYNGTKNQILCAYEDEDEKWHTVDDPASELTPERMQSSEFEGSLDKKKIKYRIVSLALEGERASFKFGDGSDWDVEDGKTFPAIPPMASASRLPKLVSNTNELKLWHVQDRVFKRPVADLVLQLNCGEASKSVLHSACADLLVNLITHNLAEISYMADVCEIESSVSSNDRGLCIRVDGFNDKLMNLFVIILETLLKFRNNESNQLPEGFKEQSFNLILESYRRKCRNKGMKADKVASSVRLRCICQRSYSAWQRLEAIEHIDIATFTTKVAELLAKIGAEGLYVGNVDTICANLAKDTILNLLKNSSKGNCGLSRKKYASQFVLRLPPKTTEVTCVSKNPTEKNSAVEFYIQVGKDNTKDRVMVDLLTEILYEPYYNQIRTKDQFGYDVCCDSRWTNGIIGIHFSVVSSSKTVQEIEERIIRFLREFRQTLADMTDEMFMGHLVGLAKDKLNMFNSLGEVTSCLWDEIRDGRYLWEAYREEVICLKTITKEETLKAYDEWIYPENKKIRQVIVKAFASEGPSSAERPDVKPEEAEKYNGSGVEAFHALCKNQTFGKIY